MDSSQFHQNGMSSANSAYASLPGISPHQLQQNSTVPAHTLPPLQPNQHAAMQPMYGSAPHTPRTPATPNTPVSANNMTFPQMGQQSRNYQMMSNNTFQQPQQGFRNMSTFPQTSTAMAHPQAIAPAPVQGRLPQALRPMPPNGLHQLSGGMQSPYGQGSMMSQLQDLEPPTHVVGSQGRRGILPSAPGRPPVSASSTGKNAVIPAKDADGKFPCPHCTKTYLHAKHLKRHLLRHTGDRPYMCILCRDTFSRSDILKRHFQKCSIRRGNPTGASHLSHSQAHLKKSHPGSHKSTNSMSESGMMDVNVMDGSPGGIPVFGIVPDGSVPDAGSNLTEEQAEQIPQPNALKQLSSNRGRDGRSLAGIGPGVSSRASYEQNYPGGMASTMPSGMNISLVFNLNNGQSGHSYNQGYDFSSHGSNTNAQASPACGQDCPSIYQKNEVNHALENHYPKHMNASIKQVDPINNHCINLFTGLYPAVSGPDPTTSFPSWNVRNDPLDDISSRLRSLCSPNHQVVGRDHGLRDFLSAENIKHCLDQFTSFQGHFPVIHVPTFRIAEADDGLLLAMICIGAVYSSRLMTAQVRDLMELVKTVLERISPVYSVIPPDQREQPRLMSEDNGTQPLDLEQIMAIVLMQILFTWHGTPVQREKARQEYPLVVDIARRAELTRPMSSPPLSLLHQPNVVLDYLDTKDFDWSGWVEQEKRSRVMFTIYLLDVSLVVYFNIAPRFERDEIQLPLPADDAAWDAPSASECAKALGLCGPMIAQSANIQGSRRVKQPEFHSAIRALTHNSGDLQPSTTNLYSKFLLVHALHVTLWLTQRQMSSFESGQLASFHPMHVASGASTPLYQQDWVRGIDPTGSGPQSANNSGRATPVDPGMGFPQTLASVNNAFEKWKRVWDEDMAEQYPPSSAHVRRFGFCRDAVPFYWLAKYILKQGRGLDRHMAPDQRFSQMISLLKTVKAWVVPDSANRGETLGSVSEIGSNYGVKDLTLDMAQLFKPINKRLDSRILGVQTNIV